MNRRTFVKLLSSIPLLGPAVDARCSAPQTWAFEFRESLRLETVQTSDGERVSVYIPTTTYHVWDGSEWIECDMRLVNLITGKGTRKVEDVDGSH